MNVGHVAAEPSIPSLWYTALELPRFMTEAGLLLSTHRWVKQFRGGEGQPTMVLPGFAAGDSSTAILRRYLKSWGYDSRPWGVGTNMDPRTIDSFESLIVARDSLIEQLADHLNDIHHETGMKVSLIGWSLGGIISRLIASRHPELVRQVITLGTPFGDPRSVVVYPLMKMIHNHSISDEQIEIWNAMCDAPMDNTPLSIVYSKSDGFVAKHIATKQEHGFSENIAVCCSHVGFIVNPMVMYVIADRLKQKENEWQAFKPEGTVRWLYE